MSHQDRREPLPKGYQFGDARHASMGPLGIAIRYVQEWTITPDRWNGRLCRDGETFDTSRDPGDEA